jgi:hypothetical protein
MTLQSSGAISLSQVNTELGLSATSPLALGAANVRGLAGVASGAIGMNSLYGKSNAPPVTLGIPVSKIIDDVNGVASGYFSIVPDGSINLTDSNNLTHYLSPIVANAGANYEARILVNGYYNDTNTVFTTPWGDPEALFNSGGWSPWLSLNVTRSMIASSGTSTYASFGGTLSIRNKSTLVTVSAQFIFSFQI